VIVFAGHDEQTTLVSPTEVTTGVNMLVWQGPDTVPVTVRNGDGPASNALLFTFTTTARRTQDRPGSRPGTSPIGPPR